MEPEPTLSVRTHTLPEPAPPKPAPRSYFWRRVAAIPILMATALVVGLCLGLLPMPGSGGRPSLAGAASGSRLYSIVLSVPVTAMTTALGVSLRCDVAAAAPGANATLLGFLQTNAQQVAVGLNDPINSVLCGGLQRRRSLGSEPQCASMGSTRGISTVNITLVQPVTASLAATLANLSASFGFVQTSAAVLADACLVPAGMSAAALLPSVLSVELASELLPSPSAGAAPEVQPSVTATRTSLTTLSSSVAPTITSSSAASPSGSVAPTISFTSKATPSAPPVPSTLITTVASPSTSSTTTASPSASTARSFAATPSASAAASPPAAAPAAPLADPMVLDIWPGATGSNPSSLTLLPGGTSFIFQAQTPTYGAEPWVSDGTSAGTVMLKDINTGTGHSWADGFVVMAGAVYFAATDSVNGRELWSTTGTAASTALVKDINPGTANSNPYSIRMLNNKLYFMANDGQGGSAVNSELWESDGTTAGTVLLKEINPGSGFGSFPGEFRLFNGLMFFQANDGVNGGELWSSDFTAAGTSLFKDIYPGSMGSNPRFLTVFNNKMYFQAAALNMGQELHVSDGTVAGTGLLMELITGTTDSTPQYFIEFNSRLFFSGATGFVGNAELFSSDGTAAGTALVKEISNLTANYQGSYPQNFVVYKGVLYFMARDGALFHNWEQWRTDGTAAGTFLVRDLNPASGEGSFSSPLVFNDVLYFGGGNAATGKELWTFTA